LTTGQLGEPNEVLWVEACDDLRARVLRLASPSTAAEDAKLRRVLGTRNLRFRAASAAAADARSRIVDVLQDRIDHALPRGAT
jgi:hypothetical protein